MLNVDKFYANYCQSVGELEHVRLNQYQVLAREDAVYLLSEDPSVDPFAWLVYPADGIVSYSRNGDLVLTLIFDASFDQTHEAIAHVNHLLGVVQ